MATLYFKVSSDWEQVVKLRQECEKLETQLRKMDSRSAPAATKTLETQLASTKQQMMGLVTEAAKAGAAVESDFKKKIYDASQTVNGLSEKIIAQRAVIKDIEFDVKRLGDAYRTALKNNPIGASGKLAEYNAARKALDEEKAALFGLTQQQAEARLSVKKLRDEYSLYKKEAGDTVEINNGLSLSWGKMLGIIGGATALKSLVSQIVRVRGEFQSMQTAIETMVGKDVASGLMAQLKEMAKISPLTLTDMVDAEKMMLGFNIQAEDTVRYLQALSDISMGDSVKFKSLTLAFSQMSAAGKLMGQDLNQMINAGFNPLQIIAEKTGKSIATLKDEMSKGAVSAEMVQQAFIDATSAGGKFYQMSENASKTINGQLSMMQDALDNAFNEMGQASEGVIMEGIQLTTTLIQNYETVGKVLVGLVATYGAYRTAVMLATIATSKHTIAEVALTNARVIGRKAQLLLNAAMLTNPYVAVATVVTALAASIWILSTRTSEAEKATERFNAIMDEHNKKEEEHKQAVDALISTIQDQNKAEGERLAAFEKLKAEYPAIFQNYTTETEFLKEIVKYKKQIAEEDARRSTASLEEQLRVEQNRLNHYRQVRASGTSTSLVDMDGNGWASDNVEDAIKAQTQIVNRLKAQISTPLVNSYLEGIKKLKDEEIKSVLDEITLSMNALGDSGKDAIAVVASLGGEFSKEQLGMIKSALETERKSRNERTTYQQDLAAAKEDWEKAKNGYEALIKDQKATSKQVIEARKKMEAAEKAYKNLSGVSLSKEERNSEKRQSKDNKIFQRSELSYAKELEKEIDKSVELASEASLQMTEDLFAEQSAMNRYLQEYGTYWQKRLAITQEYQQKIAEAGGSDTWQGRLLQKQMEEALKELDFSQFKDSINFADIFGNLDAQTTGALKSLRDKLKEYINNAAKDLRPEDLKELQDAFKDLDFKIAERDPFGEFGKSLDEYKSAQDAVTKAQQELNTVMQGGTVVTGIYTDETGKLVAETLSQAQAEERLNDAQKKRAETLADLTTAMNSIGSKGMAIVNAGNEIVGMLDNFGVEVPEAVSSTLSGLGQVMSGLESIDITKPFSLITGAVSVISGIGNTIAGWFSGDKKNEKQIQRLQDQIDTLTSSYDKLGRAVEDAYSKDASDLIEQQNEMLEQQKALIEQQIREEEDKKKTDDGRIEEWKQQLEEINQTIEDNKEAALDAIFGEDLQSAIDSFSSAYADAWTNGEDRAQSARDTVKKMMQQMVTESIKAAMQSSGSMEEIRQKLQQFYADNILTGWEQDYIYNMAEELQKELDKQFGWADSLMGGDAAKKQQSASSAYGTEMTQDQAGELTGRFTAFYESSLRQETIQQGISNIAEENRSIIAQSYLELQRIGDNTEAIIKPIQQMQQDIAEVKQNTSRL